MTRRGHAEIAASVFKGELFIKCNEAAGVSASLEAGIDNQRVQHHYFIVRSIIFPAGVGIFRTLGMPITLFTRIRRETKQIRICSSGEKI